MKSVMLKDKHLKLDQAKIKRAKEILKARTETEAIEKSLELVIATDLNAVKRSDIFKRILMRRSRLAEAKGDVAEWVRKGREERNGMYGG